jgi:tetratricopeptide (TPR) repeat protein
MNVLKNRKSRALIIMMCALVLFSIIFSHLYYKNINASVDPRILEARLLYENYNIYTAENAFDSIFWLMDKIESIYINVDYYRDSYEIGVLYNNRAASWLMKAQLSDPVQPLHQDSLIQSAESAIIKSIDIYNTWLSEFSDKDEEVIDRMIRDEFLKGMEEYSPEQQEAFLMNRIDEIVDSQTETNRRLSVAYTNLGIIYRHNLQYDSAALSYKKAIDLWDRNLTAENNLNMLLGRPLKKRSFLQKLFPPDRD